MDNKKIEEILKYSKPKIEIDKDHKEGLRRELLNSKKFGTQRDWLTKNKMIFALSLSIAILLIILNPGFEEKQISAAELLDKVKANYADFNIADQLSIVNSSLKIYGLEDEKIELDIVRKINFRKGEQRLTLLMKSSNEILDDYIITNNKMYRTNDPKIDFQLNVPREELSKVVNSFNYSYGTDSTANTKVLIKQIENCDSYIVYKSNYVSSEVGTTQEHKLKIDGEVNIDQYLRDNPVHIAGDLNHEKIKILKVDNDDDLVVIQLEKEIEPKEYKLFLKGFKNNTHHEDSAANFLFEFNHINIDSLVKTEIGTRNVKKVQSVTVNAESGEILHVKYQINRNGEMTRLSEQSFDAVSKIKHSGNEFDIEGNGFVFAYKIK